MIYRTRDFFPPLPHRFLVSFMNINDNAIKCENNHSGVVIIYILYTKLDRSSEFWKHNICLVALGKDMSSLKILLQFIILKMTIEKGWSVFVVNICILNSVGISTENTTIMRKHDSTLIFCWDVSSCNYIVNTRIHRRAIKVNAHLWLSAITRITKSSLNASTPDAGLVPLAVVVSVFDGLHIWSCVYVYVKSYSRINENYNF